MLRLVPKEILVKTLDKEGLDHPEWHEDLKYPDLPTALPDVQRRIGLGASRILIEVLYILEEKVK